MEGKFGGRLIGQLPLGHLGGLDEHLQFFFRFQLYPTHSDMLEMLILVLE